MCLIIHRPIGSTIPQEWIDSAIVANPDGWGIMTSDTHRLHVARGMSRKGFAKALKRFAGEELFIHFRFATHGNVDTDNCHPFLIVRDQYAVMHNGVINIDTSTDESKSDTWHYANRFLAPMLTHDDVSLACPKIADAIGKHVGISNKIVILHASGLHTIVNRAQGIERDGCWLSNGHSIASRWDDYDTFSLSDLRKLSREELIDLCMSDPDLVADCIMEDATPFRYSFDRDYR